MFTFVSFGGRLGVVSGPIWKAKIDPWTLPITDLERSKMAPGGVLGRSWGLHVNIRHAAAHIKYKCETHTEKTRPQPCHSSCFHPSKQLWHNLLRLSNVLEPHCWHFGVQNSTSASSFATSLRPACSSCRSRSTALLCSRWRYSSSSLLACVLCASRCLYKWI